MKGNLFNTMRLVIYIWALETYFLYGNIEVFPFPSLARKLTRLCFLFPHFFLSASLC